MSLSALLLLLLAAASVHADVTEEVYGTTVRIKMRFSTHSVKFWPLFTEPVIIWKLNDPSVSVDRRRRVIDGYLVISNVTQQDNGRYQMLGRNDRYLTSRSLNVVPQSKRFELKSEEQLRFTFPLDKDHCNIYFLPKDDEELTNYETQLVRSGMKWPTGSSCSKFEFVRPCGLELEMHMLCDGVFEVRDQHKGVALMVHVDWIDEPYNLAHIGTSIGAFCASLFCCCCVRRCCCGKSSKKKDTESADAADAAEPAVAYHQNASEPVALRPVQICPPSERLYPAQPSYAPTVPLQIHNPLDYTMDMPPAYSELEHRPSFPLASDPELQFELKGMNVPSAPPLGSDPTYNSVYTSTKLDFL